LRRGLLLRAIRFEDGEGRRSTLEERRLVSMADMHLAGLELALTAENWSAGVTVRSGIDGRVVNAGAKLYERFDNRHLAPIAGGPAGDEGVYLLVHTNQSDLAIAARTRASLRSGDGGSPASTAGSRDDRGPAEGARRRVEEPAYVAEEFQARLQQGETLVVEKVIALHTSRDAAISECGLAARKAIARAPGFESVLGAHALAWRQLWRRFDVHLRAAGDGFPLNVPMLLRLNMFHLLQAASLGSIGLDIGVPARGWTGEAYQGHVF